jgi:hypothetical protein
VDRCQQADKDKAKEQEAWDLVLKRLKFIDHNMTRLCAEKDIAHDAPPGEST